MSTREISIPELEHLLADEKGLLIDMRDARSFHRSHHPRAIPMLNSLLRQLVKSTDNSLPLVFCCQDGTGSRDMAEVFADLGFEQAFSISGGYDSWARHAATSQFRLTSGREQQAGATLSACA